MKNQFVKISPTIGPRVWVNVDNVISLKEDTDKGLLTITTNGKREDHPISYTVKSDVDSFLSAIGVKEIEL